MFIDLKNPAEFTIENVRKLIASKDDSELRQLRVTKTGLAFLSDEVGNNSLSDIKFRFETMCPGNGYCGNVAATDNSYVEETFHDLKVAWEKGLVGFIDVSPDEL